jgi:tellurite resistance protein TerC
MSNELILWIVFGVTVLVMLALDLGIFHRRAHVIEVKEALMWSAVWIALALLFNLVIYFLLGSDMALKFLTGYVVEKSLSVDNLFVFLMIFSYFAVPSAYQHKVLFWGILGALIMRAIFIATGLIIVERIHWVIYLFGAFLIFTGIRILLRKGKELHPEDNAVLKLFCRFMPVTNDYHEDRFWLKKNGGYLATPLFLVLLVIETTDVVFAVDSIPAILAITLDPLIVYSSNVFAILGLRALYFALAAAIQRWRYLHYGLSAILVFLGLKMLSSGFFKVPTGIALGVVAAILAVSAIASVLRRREKEIQKPPENWR